MFKTFWGMANLRIMAISSVGIKTIADNPGPTSFYLTTPYKIILQRSQSKKLRKLTRTPADLQVTVSSISHHPTRITHVNISHS